ncbi:MAG: hypothetical protein N2483_11005, partial [Burkholderiaceae bacterium]|nr:hypothetical protein [Burkholderiaceae bacterium]
HLLRPGASARMNPKWAAQDRTRSRARWKINTMMLRLAAARVTRELHQANMPIQCTSGRLPLIDPLAIAEGHARHTANQSGRRKPNPPSVTTESIASFVPTD